MSEKRIRVLLMTNGFQENTSGGIAAFCTNYSYEMNPEKFKFDFLTIAYQAFELYRERIESRGGTLYCLNIHKFRGLKGKQAYMKAFKNFLSNHTYDVIHINMGSFFTVFLCSLIAKKYGKGAKVIAHSHSNLTYTGINKIAVKLTKPFFSNVADRFLACSNTAGGYMFPNSIIRSSKYCVLNNAIDPKLYLYDPRERNRVRTSFGIGERILVGHVGRFAKAKNHSFLIDVFAAIHKKQPESLLMLVGAGDLEQEIRNKVSHLNLQNAVIFAGLRSDVHQLMQAMDVMVVPSVFEGFGIVIIEAQASDLPVLISTNITEETRITDSYSRLSLDESPEKWAEEALDLCVSKTRTNQIEAIIGAGFDIKSESNKLAKLYIELAEEKGA